VAGLQTVERGDQGVDVLAKKDSLRLAIQAKRYIGAVSNAAIQQVFAGMAHYKCHRCLVVTSGEFTSGAIALAQSTGCLLIGTDRIAALIRGEIAF
jgi:restriction system protein